MLLWPYRGQVDIEEEKWLYTQGIRIDVLVIKKDPSVEIDCDICRIFRAHNIIEYKRNDDELNMSVYAKVMGYANLYKSREISADSIPYGEISATIYRHAYPRDAFRKLQELGATVEKKYPGVYYVKGTGLFPVQVLVGKELDPKEYAMFRVLVPGASDDDIRMFKDMAVQNKDAAYQQSVDNIFQVSVSANKDTYARLMKEDPEMCDALRDLMRDEFIDTERRGEMRGEIRGAITEAIKLYHDEMDLSPSEITVKIMGRFSLEKDEAEKYVEETLGLQPA